MDEENRRYCKNPECGEWLDPEYIAPNGKFCSRRCRNRDYHVRKGMTRQDRLYAEQKKRWNRSSLGRKAGLSMYKWWHLPKWLRKDMGG